MSKNPIQKKESKDIKSDNFCYFKVRNEIAEWEAKVKIKQSYSVPQIIAHFRCTNKIFADCIMMHTVILAD